jgi:hypothetical protein
MKTSPVSVLIKSMLIFSFLILVIGCTHHLVPNAQRVNENRISDFTTTQRINIVNNQPSTEKVTFLSGMNTYYGNLNEWTDEAVNLLKMELQQKGAAIDPGADKVIKLSIIEAKLIQGAIRLRCDLNLRVETGDGYTNEFFVQNLSGGDHARASGGAITLALTDMLNDKNIIEYLK